MDYVTLAVQVAQLLVDVATLIVALVVLDEVSKGRNRP